MYRLFLILMIIFAASVSSFGLDGDGEGGGQNQDDPLILVTCNIQDNQTGVPIDTKIQLEFNKNVVNMTVAENNKKCITLSGEEGNVVPIGIQMGDDQVDPTIKRLITIVPGAALEEGKTYTLTISGDFRAKNGTSLGVPIILSFQAGRTEEGQASEKGDDIKASASTDSGIISEPRTSEEALNTTAEGLSGDLSERTNSEKEIDRSPCPCWAW